MFYILTTLLWGLAVAEPYRAKYFPAKDQKAAVPSRYIVKVAHKTPTSVIREFVAQKKFSTLAALQSKEIPLINAISLNLTVDAVNALRTHTSVEYVEQVQRVKVSYDWGIDRINQKKLPLDYNTTTSGNGRGVNVFVIDTGVMINHPQFEGRAKFGFSAIDGQYYDGNGHGTHCAGTIASRDYGVAPKATIYSVKVLSDDGYGTNEGVALGMNWVARNRGSSPAVASMSLGGGYSQAINDAVAALIRNNVIVAVAAGNENQDACYGSPSSAPYAITTAASDRYDQKASFSNWGRCVDIIAPGVAITSTWNNGGTNTISGTSMATPHVAGVAAAYLSLFPRSSATTVRDALLSAATPNVIKGFGSSTVNRLLYSVFTQTAEKPTRGPNVKPKPKPKPVGSPKPPAVAPLKPVAAPPKTAVLPAKSAGKA